jgi:hypothetical protein
MTIVIEAQCIDNDCIGSHESMKSVSGLNSGKTHLVGRVGMTEQSQALENVDGGLRLSAESDRIVPHNPLALPSS